MKNWQDRQFSQPQAALKSAAQGGARMKNWQDRQFSQPQVALKSAAQGGAV